MGHLAIELAHGALRAGSPLRGVISVEAERLRRLTGLRVEALGLEILGVGSRYRPAVYRQPVPRPWGRTRSGARRVDFRASATLVEAPCELEPGRHCWPFRLEIPAAALPTYGGANLVCEHEVSAVAQFADGPTLRAWSPLHLWTAPASAPPREPLEIEGPDPRARGPLALFAAGLSGPLALRVSGPSRVLGLGEATLLTYAVDNPTGRPLPWLRLELIGVETTRHRAATDLGRFVVDQRDVRLPREPSPRGVVSWQVPPLAAPTLKAKRFAVRWELHASVSGPWNPGVRGHVDLVLYDPADEAPPGEQEGDEA